MKCNNLEFFELSNEILTRGSKLRFQARGWSMHPFIKDGDIIEVESIDGDKIKLGDVIFYHTRDKCMAAHRVIKKIFRRNKPVFITKGDSSNEGEKINPEQVLGRVGAIEREGRRININGSLNRFIAMGYAWLKKFAS